MLGGDVRADKKEQLKPINERRYSIKEDQLPI
jgi:hypothetical protein